MKLKAKRNKTERKNTEKLYPIWNNSLGQKNSDRECYILQLALSLTNSIVITNDIADIYLYHQRIISLIFGLALTNMSLTLALPLINDIINISFTIS